MGEVIKDNTGLGGTTKEIFDKILDVLMGGKRSKEARRKAEEARRKAEEAEKARRKAEEAERKAEEARRKTEKKDREGSGEQDAKRLYRNLAKKYHPDRTGEKIIHEILKRDLTATEKEQLKNELDILRKLNNKIFQEINKNKDKPEFLKNYVEPKEYKDAIENLETKLNEIKSNEGQLNNFQSN